eukprot:GHVQ01040405.1.p1 GENE.GHVQ01040405.1~~GHVQ01040405.1.p1  ORF type:complete len:222 (+),score=12.67 GHVQ01040405.1:138-803(+)
MTDAATITAPTVMGRERREKSREVRSTGARNRTVKRMLIGGVLAYIIQFSFCVNHCVFPNTFIGVTAALVSPFNGSQTVWPFNGSLTVTPNDFSPFNGSQTVSPFNGSQTGRPFNASQTDTLSGGISNLPFETIITVLFLLVLVGFFWECKRSAGSSRLSFLPPRASSYRLVPLTSVHQPNPVLEEEEAPPPAYQPADDVPNAVPPRPKSTSPNVAVYRRS